MSVSGQHEEEIGFIKYAGGSVGHGIIDAGSAGHALIGLDDALRYFNSQQSPELAQWDYGIPVRTQAGSWEAVVLGAGAVAGAFALGYAKKAGEKMAENDFKSMGLGDVLRKSMAALQGFIKLVKHTGKKKGWDTADLVWKEAKGEVGLRNSAGEVLFIPIDFLKWYAALPPGLLSKLTSVVADDRTLTIGVNTPTGLDTVTVSDAEKVLFKDESVETEEAALFPELEHGSLVRLKGKLIRGSEASNSVGLEYEGHVINCVPEAGKVRQFKRALFLKCVVEGRVTRHTKNRFVADKRPTIILSRVSPIEQDDQSDLFDN